jgi:predicted secreted protein
MATTGVVNTTLFTFRAGASGGTVVSNQNDFSISFTHEPRDTTTKDSGGYRTLLEGLRSYEVSVSGLLAFNDSLSVFTSTTGLNAVLKARTMQTWIAGTGVSGDPKLSGEGYFTSLEVGSPDQENNCTWSCTLQGNGQWYEGTF